MSNHEALAAALRAVFACDESNQTAAATALAGALTAFQAPMLAEMQKQTTLLELLAKQGKRMLSRMPEIKNPPPDFDCELPVTPPPGRGPGYWQYRVGSSEPTWKETAPPVRTPAHSTPGP